MKAGKLGSSEYIPPDRGNQRQRMRPPVSPSHTLVLPPATPGLARAGLAGPESAWARGARRGRTALARAPGGNP
ncbi:hypothetical protein RR42_s1061 [Cupriavidus basilensis]|uniref:Uncharacterized protein n=1 Tax=Cupriavidus basilensis TaxID=68895 RepID=A0A0C4YJ59_9BURK|nr:hypothetical protein RR42_s1061 [Cupriavidus basilensis]